MRQIPISKIDFQEEFDEKNSFDYHDLLRDGKSVDLSPTKVSAMFKKLVLKINELVDEINKKP